MIKIMSTISLMKKFLTHVNNVKSMWDFMKLLDQSLKILTILFNNY